ncbi:DUF1127 domain-containing protein [Celeribacter arenosi]|uniref:YjiS-like domain-containing protein n=1 Tax=Celeribacter arenosi TaxID=792649 RepID=A0ABP7JSE9_9RHOB
MQALSLSTAAGARRAPSIVSRVVTALKLARTRQSLSKLDDHMLADIGLTREEARRESERPLWDAPRSWTC